MTGCVAAVVGGLAVVADAHEEFDVAVVRAV